MTRLIIFFIVEIKLDITFFITIVVYFVKNSSHAYIKVIKKLFYYLKKLINYNIIYDSNRENFFIKDYLDFN